MKEYINELVEDSGGGFLSFSLLPDLGLSLKGVLAHTQH